MEWTRSSLTFVLALGLACGSDDAPELEADGSSETGATTTGDSSDPTTTTNEPMPDGSTSGTSDTGPDPDTSSDGADTSDTDTCPAGTDGCPCGMDGACDEGLVCGEGDVCQPEPECRELDTEPNEDEASAPTLTELGCGSMLDLGPLGTLAGPESDWYRFFGDEGVILCPERPEVTVTAAIDPEVCVFVECLEGTASGIECGGGSMPADSPEGRPGCCGTGSARIQDYECGGIITPRNVNVWVEVSTDEATCADYEFAYSF